MMNNLSDDEFCTELWLANPGPDVRRLLTMVKELVEWKCIFKLKGPEEVEDTIRNQDSEIEVLHDDNAELQRQIDELKSRTVYDMLKGLSDEMTRQRAEVRDARERVWEANKSEEQMRQKLDMWAILNR